MRGRETRLGYWLGTPPGNGRPALWTRLKWFIQRHLKAGRLQSSPRDLALALEARVSARDDWVPAQTPILDGLGFWAKSAGVTPDTETIGTFAIHSITPLLPAIWKPLLLPGELPVRINSQVLLAAVSVRSMRPVPLARRARVRSAACFGDPPPARSFSRWLSSACAIVRTGTPRIALLAHANRSLEPGEIKEAERENYLREAEALKRVPPGEGELLGVFRSVPIELISKLSFSQEKRVICYILIADPPQRRTRVHDVAAVRDLSSGEVHLVPHRTRFRTVFLS